MLIKPIFALSLATFALAAAPAIQPRQAGDAAPADVLGTSCFSPIHAHLLNLE